MKVILGRIFDANKKIFPIFKGNLKENLNIFFLIYKIEVMWTKESVKQNFVWVIRLQVDGSPIFGVDRRGMTFSRKFVSSNYESDRYSILKEVSPPLSCFHGGHGFESKKL